MKKLLFLLVTLTLFTGLSIACADTAQLHLDVEFDQNIIMARYDVDGLINTAFEDAYDECVFLAG